MIGTPNNVVLTAKDGFAFEDGTENGAKTLESAQFNPSKPILPITVINNHVDIIVGEIETPIESLQIGVQKLFNIDADSFKNVTAELKMVSTSLGTVKVVLTAKEGFIFTNGTNTLESVSFVFVVE